MKFHITVRNWWLLAACGVLAGGAVWFIVLDDWRHGAELSADHGMFFLLFFASLLSGLFIGPAARAKKFGTALVLSIVTLASAFLLVAESAGRVAKVSFTAEALANKDEGVMKDALADLKKARAALSDANANFAKECGTGRGLRCAGLKEAVNALEMQFYKAQTRLDSLKPAAPSNGTAAYFTAVAEVIGSADSARWGRGYVLASPLARVFTFDVCILVLLHLALGVELRTQSAATPIAGEIKRLPAPKVLEAIEIDDPVIAALRDAGEPLTNNELAKRLGVVKSTTSKAVSSRPDLFRKERVGREVRISLAH